MKINLEEKDEVKGIVVLSGTHNSSMRKIMWDVYKEGKDEESFFVGLDYKLEMCAIMNNLERNINFEKTDNEIINKINDVLKERFNMEEILCNDIQRFLLLKALILENIITNKGLLVIEALEAEMHPKYQILFCELLVMIKKKYKTDILLATHSPYIVFALENYSMLYTPEDRTKFYFIDKENSKVVIKNVSEEVNVIYSSLGNPFFELENLECELSREAQNEHKKI